MQSQPQMLSSLEDSAGGGHLDNATCTLPPFTPLVLSPSNDYEAIIESSYNQVVHWSPNLFSLPVGNAASLFVRKLADLLSSYSVKESNFTLKAAMLFPALLLQRPHKNLKPHEHLACLKRRLPLWDTAVGIQELVKEGNHIQRHLPSTPRRFKKKYNNLAKRFSNLMTCGKVKDAIRILSEGEGGGVLKLSDVVTEDGKTALEVLREKHPPGQPPHIDTLIPPDNAESFSNSVFQALDGAAVKRAALRTFGSAGPSGVDAAAWRRWCTCYGLDSVALCNSVASLGRKISTIFVDPAGLSAFTACRLIPLDKKPGVRPIGVAEVCRRIIGKAIIKIVKIDIQESLAACQFCVGFDSGCEAAVHCMSKVYHDNEASLFVDATNAFNSLNRASTLSNVSNICPALAPILINTYRNNGALFVNGTTMTSREGTTQGDPLGMAMYAVGIQPLITHLGKLGLKQVWYADDSAAGGSLEKLKSWWNELCSLGPKFGYYPNDAKTFLVVKQGLVQKSREIFGSTNIKIVEDGVKYLGGVIGCKSFTVSVLKSKVQSWCEQLDILIKIAESEPHAAFSAFTHGISSQWLYFSRVVNVSSLSTDDNSDNSDTT
jgi:hypothetical protein